MKYFCFSVFLIISCIITVSAQEKKLIQLSGRIINELLEPMPFSHVLILNSYRGTISNNDGRYSLVVEEGDTVLFSAVGYKRKYYKISRSLPDRFLHLDVMLEIDTFMIEAVEIYPWKSYEEFKEAFVNLKLPDDDMEKARKNIALLRTQIIMDYEPDARSNFREIMEQQYRQTFNQGLYPTYQITNPFAWAEFFKALKRGDFKSKKNKSGN